MSFSKFLLLGRRFEVEHKSIGSDTIWTWLLFKEASMSLREMKWIQKWVDEKLAAGGIVGRELKSVLGRLSFVAGALKHVRPFLAPLFSWPSTLAGGAFAVNPAGVV